MIHRTPAQPQPAPQLHLLAVGRIQPGHRELRVAPRPTSPDIMLAAMSWGRQLFVDGAPRTACRNHHEQTGWDEAADEVDALLAEMFAKPGLGVEDSAGDFDLFDYAAEADDLAADMLDREDWAAGRW
jgi:hypothetical protein